MAKYSDLTEIDNNILNRATEAAQIVCYHAVNLLIEYRSSELGTNSYWEVRISPHCSIHLKYQSKLPKGHGSHINLALEDFSSKCNSLGDRGED